MFWVLFVAILGIFMLLGFSGYQITAYITYVIVLGLASIIVVLLWRHYTIDRHNNPD